MNKYYAIAISALLFASLAEADSIETDIIYGSGSIKSSMAMPYDSNYDVSSHISTDIIYGGIEQVSSPFTPFERFTGVDDINTDIIYGP